MTGYLRFIGLTALLAACWACSSDQDRDRPDIEICLDCDDGGELPMGNTPPPAAMDSSVPGSMDAAMDAQTGDDEPDTGSDLGDADATVPIDECEPGALRCLGKELAACGDAGDTLEVVERCSERGERCVNDECRAVAPGTLIWDALYESGGQDFPWVLGVDAEGSAIASFGLGAVSITLDDSGVAMDEGSSRVVTYDANGRLLLDEQVGPDLNSVFQGIDAQGDQVFVHTESSPSGSRVRGLFLGRRDSSGAALTTRDVGETWVDGIIEDVSIAPDGSVYVCLVLNVNTLRVLKLDREAQLVWDTLIGPSGARAYCGADAQSHALVTHSRDTTTRDARVLELDDEGNVAWDFSLDIGDADITTDIGADSDGNTYVIGALYEDHGWLRKLDATGNEQWDRTLPGADTVPTAVAVDPSSGDVVIAFGEVTTMGDSITRVRKYDAAGRELWTATTGEPGVQVWPTDLAIAPDGDVVMLGSKDLGAGAGYDIWLARYAP